MKMLFGTANEREQAVEKYGAVEGMNQMLEDLENYLAKVSPSDGKTSFHRVNKSIIATVYVFEVLSHR